MAVQHVRLYPDPILRQTAEAVEDFESDEFKTLIEDLKDTAKARSAQGLAAPQIGVPKRVFVSREGEDFKVYVNPTLVLEGEEVPNREGCLSFPGVLELVTRPEEVTVTAKNAEGEEFTVYADDVESVAIQHENDHLNGVLFIDRVSRLKRRYILKKLEKTKKRYNIR